MSNTYRYCFPAVSHFQVPHALDKWLNSISLEELRLLLLVQSEAEKLSRSEVPLSTDQICQRTGMHKTNISKVRRALTDYGLLLTRQVGRNYIYAVTDPNRKVPVVDKYSLMTIDFDAPASVLTKYIKAVLKDSKLTKEGINGHCPFPTHQDGTASFTMDVDAKGRWWCRGCAKSGSLIALEQYLSEDAMGNTISADQAHTIVRDKLRALGLGKASSGKSARPADIQYPYLDEYGETVFEVVRRNGRKDKTIQRRPDPTKPDRWIYNTDGCENVLYHLPQILESLTVVVVEGEKDADTLDRLGLLDSSADRIAVTTCRNGAGSWQPEHSVALLKKRVILCGDTDERGKDHMRQVKSSLEAAGVKDIFSIQLPPEYKDVTDFLDAHRPSKFVELVGEDWLEHINEDVTEV